MAVLGRSLSVSDRDDAGDTVKAFEQEAAERRPSVVEEFLSFLAHNKKWWLLPIVAVLLLVSALVFLGSTAAAPFVYTLF